MTGRVIILLASTNGVVDRAVSPNERGLTRFGVVTFDAAGTGRFEGRVPELEPSRYIAAGYCKSCRPSGTIFTVGEFVISGSVLPRTGLNLGSLLLLGVATLVTGLVMSKGRQGVCARELLVATSYLAFGGCRATCPSARDRSTERIQ